MRLRWIPAAMLVGVTASAAGCSDGNARSADTRRTDSAPSGRVVDSIIPIEESLRRFRQHVPEVTELRGGAGSREELVRTLIRALEARDTAAVRRMGLTTGEFAWLYYPTSSLARPPYELPPDLMWFQLQGQSEHGATRLLSLRAGQPLGYLGHGCDSTHVEGENRVYGHCAVRRRTQQGDTVAERLFGVILERGGKFKFVSYGNNLD